MTIDWTARMWRMKRRIYAGIHPRTTLSTPSRWLSNIMHQSPLTAHLRCEAFPNGISLEPFCPGDRQSARKAYGLSARDKVIMCSYASLGDAWRKGDDFLIPVLKAMPTELARDAVLLLVGQKPETPAECPIRQVPTGFLAKDEQLAECYNAADVFLNLSRADNLPNCLVESAACGLPAVTLDNGGCGETVVHGQTGFAVKSVDEAAKTLTMILGDESTRERFSREARVLAAGHYSDVGYARHIVDLSETMRHQDQN